MTSWTLWWERAAPVCSSPKLAWNFFRPSCRRCALLLQVGSRRRVDAGRHRAHLLRSSWRRDAREVNRITVLRGALASSGLGARALLQKGWSSNADYRTRAGKWESCWACGVSPRAGAGNIRGSKERDSRGYGGPCKVCPGPGGLQRGSVRPARCSCRVRSPRLHRPRPARWNQAI